MLLTRWLTLRSLRTRWLRTLLSGFGIVLGVAGLLAIQVTNQTAMQSLTRIFEDTSGKSDLLVTSASSTSESIPQDVLRKVEGHTGVRYAIPVLRVQTALADSSQPEQIELGLFGPSVGGLSLYGIDPTLDTQARDYRLTAGEFLSSDLEQYDIVLVDSYARDNEIKVGSELALVTPNGAQELQVVGLIAKDGPGNINNGAFGVIPLQTAQDLFNRQDELDQLDLVSDIPGTDSASLERLKSDLQSRLGDEYTVTFPAAQGERAAQMLEGYQIGLNFLSGMALFVGAFLIYNAFSMTVVERTREFGFLRTVGMTRRQVAGQVLVEAGLLGLLGSLLGAGLGILLARGLSGMMALVLNQEVQDIQIPPEVLAASLAMGLGVTLVAAAIPAWQAGRISPLEALRIRGLQREGWLIRNGWLVGALLLAISTVILVLNPFPYDVQFRLGSLTVSFLFFGATLMIPASVGIWERLVRPLVQRIYGSGGRLGSSNIQRARLRTTLTVAALMIGASMILITRGMTDSFRIDLEEWINAYIGGDILVSSSLPMRSHVWRRLESVPGVAAVAPIRYFEVTWDKPDGTSEDLTFMALDPAPHTQVTSFVFSDSQQDPQAAVERLAAGEAVFVSSVLSEKYGLQPGDRVRLRTRSGPHDFEVAAVVVDFFNQGLVIQGSWGDMRRYFKLEDASALLVKTEDGVTVDVVQASIDALYGQRENLSTASNSSIISRALTLLQQAYSLFDVLALIAMFVAALGVVNTLTMNVMERTQEIGMLRSIGLTRRQVLMMILAEAGLMGLIGGALGLLFGVILTRIFLLSMTAMSGYKIAYNLPLQAALAGFAIAFFVSQLAALLPARRAARIRVLEAIHYE